MIAPKRKQNCYDHRLRDAVFHLGQATTARYLDIPRSTIHGWKKARTKPVVTLVAPNSYVEELERRVHLLERRTASCERCSDCALSCPIRDLTFQKYPGPLEGCWLAFFSS